MSKKRKGEAEINMTAAPDSKTVRQATNLSPDATIMQKLDLKALNTLQEKLKALGYTPKSSTVVSPCNDGPIDTQAEYMYRNSNAGPIDTEGERKYQERIKKPAPEPELTPPEELNQSPRPGRS